MSEFELTDDGWMQRAINGDANAFDQIVKRHQHRLQRYANRMLGGDTSSASDVVVGALVRLWETRYTYCPNGKLGSWRLKVTHRLCLDALRQKQPSSQLNFAIHPVTDAGFDSVQHEALVTAVRVAVMSLPEIHRSVFILSVYEGLSYDEISEVLDIPPGTVASRKNTAIQNLRRQLVAWDTEK